MCHVCHPTSTSGPRSALHTALATRGLSPSSARGGRKKLPPATSLSFFLLCFSPAPLPSLSRGQVHLGVEREGGGA